MNPTSLLSGLGAAVAAEPTLGGVGGTGRESAPGTADLFMALVVGLLDGQGTGAPTAAPGETAVPEGEVVPGPAVPTTGIPSDATTDVTGDEPAGGDLIEVLPDATEVALAASVLPLIVQPPLLAQALPAAAAPSLATDPAGPPAPVTAVAADVAAGVAASAGGAESQADAGQGAGGDAAGDTGTPGGTAAPAAAPTGVPSSGPSTSSPVSGVDGVAAPAGPAAPAESAPAPAARVTGQVFPEVVRVATSTVDGGPSRVTVKLNPESLGEVRIVLTSRRGELEVSLAAGQDARRALAEGAPELHRLLEAVGRTDARIVLRDLPGVTPVVPTAQDGAPRTDVSTDLSGDAWSGAGRPGGEPAADRDGARQYAGSTNATDGTTSATSESRPVTTSGQRPTGVDLTM